MNFVSPKEWLPLRIAQIADFCKLSIELIAAFLYIQEIFQMNIVELKEETWIFFLTFRTNHTLTIDVTGIC